MRRHIPVALLVVLAASGCGGGGSDSKNAAPPSFAGVPWTLASGLQVPGWEQSRPSAEFVDGVVGGSTGCNHYTAPYTVDGSKLDIDTGTAASTQMACPPPRDGVERAYLASLGKVAAWSMDGAQLVLSDSGGDELLRYEMPTLDGSYEATAVRSIDAFASLVPGTKITATFANGTVTGSAGCNTYSAAYTTDRGHVTVAPPTATRKLCSEPAGVMLQEADYLAALHAADHFRVDGSSLALLAADGTYLVTYATTGP